MTIEKVESFYFNILSFIRSFGEQESLIAIGAFHPQEAVGGVSNSRWQHFVPEHGVNDRALPITGSVNAKGVT